MAASGHISDSDHRIAYVPKDPAPSGCADDASDAGCLSRWWSTNSSISLHVTAGPDTSLEFSFEGVGIQLWGSTSGAGAVARASVDSGPDTVVNFVSEDQQPHNNVLLFNQSSLSAQPHTLRISYDSASSASDAEGGRKFMFIDWFEVIPRSTSTSTSILPPTAPSSASQATATPSSPSVTPVSTQTPIILISTQTLIETISSGPSAGRVETLTRTITLLDMRPEPSNAQAQIDEPGDSATNETAERIHRIVVPIGILSLLAAIIVVGHLLRRRRRLARTHSRQFALPSVAAHPFTTVPEAIQPDAVTSARPRSKQNSVLNGYSHPPDVPYEPSIASMESGSTKVG